MTRAHGLGLGTSNEAVGILTSPGSVLFFFIQ